MDFISSVAAAIACHALLLFGFRLETPARQLTSNENTSSMDVSLVDSAPSDPPAFSPDPELHAPPAPMIPPPDPPQSNPLPTPEPVASTPVPSVVATRAPEALKEKPRTNAPKPRSAAGSTHPAPTVTVDTKAETTGLNTKPRYRNNPQPLYPVGARQAREEGVVIVSAQVEANGSVGNVSVARSSGFSDLDAAALQAVRRWTFVPATAAGFPIASHVNVPVKFSLTDSSR